MNKNIMLMLFMVFGLIGSGNILGAESQEKAKKHGRNTSRFFVLIVMVPMPMVRVLW